MRNNLWFGKKIIIGDHWYIMEPFGLYDAAFALLPCLMYGCYFHWLPIPPDIVWCGDSTKYVTNILSGDGHWRSKIGSETLRKHFRHLWPLQWISITKVLAKGVSILLEFVNAFLGVHNCTHPAGLHIPDHSHHLEELQRRPEHREAVLVGMADHVLWKPTRRRGPPHIVRIWQCIPLVFWWTSHAYEAVWSKIKFLEIRMHGQQLWSDCWMAFSILFISSTLFLICQFCIMVIQHSYLRCQNLSFERLELEHIIYNIKRWFNFPVWLMTYLENWMVVSSCTKTPNIIDRMVNVVVLGTSGLLWLVLRKQTIHRVAQSVLKPLSLYSISSHSWTDSWQPWQALCLYDLSIAAGPTVQGSAGWVGIPKFGYFAHWGSWHESY